jgi:hypothetical protein
MSFPIRLHLTVRSMMCLAVIVGSLVLLESPPAASAYPDITIYLTNAPSYCVNRQGGGNSTGTTVFLWACSGGNNHWYETPAQTNAFLACAAEQCISFRDYWNFDECFGINDNNRGTLGSCNAEQQMWISGPTTELHNAAWGWMLVTPSDTNGSVLATSTSTAYWHQWSGW